MTEQKVRRIISHEINIHIWIFSNHNSSLYRWDVVNAQKFSRININLNFIQASNWIGYELLLNPTHVHNRKHPADRNAKLKWNKVKADLIITKKRTWYHSLQFSALYCCRLRKRDHWHRLRSMATHNEIKLTRVRPKLFVFRLGLVQTMNRSSIKVKLNLPKPNWISSR
jgi:hypothetical protein